MIIINPGSGPVRDANEEDAKLNIEQFIKDLNKESIISYRNRKCDEEGRYRFTLSLNGCKHQIDMPGIPLEQVRYMDTEEQNIWHYPRLYVDGSSWVWLFALDQCDFGTACAEYGETEGKEWAEVMRYGKHVLVHSDCMWEDEVIA